MRQLIVHIGAPKAGSTSLQQQLIANRETLSGRGIGLVAPWGASVEGLARFGDALLGRISSAERRRAIGDLRQVAGDFHGDTLILSYENLQQAAWWRRLPQKLRAIAEGAEAFVPSAPSAAPAASPRRPDVSSEDESPFGQ